MDVSADLVMLILCCLCKIVASGYNVVEQFGVQVGKASQPSFDSSQNLRGIKQFVYLITDTLSFYLNPKCYFKCSENMFKKAIKAFLL